MPRMPRLIAKSEWGSALHTALRKCCDSTPSTIAYNAIRELETSWELYLRYITENAADGEWQNVKTASLDWDAHACPAQEINMAIILSCAFKLFDDSDWRGYCEYLREEPGR